MKATGIVRKVDELGRIVIPVEIRRIMEIEEKDPLEIFTDDNGMIILRKYGYSCAFCSSENEVKMYQGKNICSKCISKISKL